MRSINALVWSDEIIQGHELRQRTDADTDLGVVRGIPFAEQSLATGSLGLEVSYQTDQPKAASALCGLGSKTKMAGLDEI
jgi:hypothetical protein